MTNYRDIPHPSDADLFLYIEDELESRARHELQQHLAACWECRVRKEDFDRGIRNFMEYRRDVLLPALTPPPGNAYALRSRISRAPEAMFRMLPAPGGFRSVPMASGISMVLVIALLAAYVLRPPQLTASEFLRNAQQASDRPVPVSKMRAQRVQIRQGARSIEREIVHSQNGETMTASVDSQWNLLLANLPVNVEDPLNPAEFAAWHARQHSPRDEIIDSGQTITLISTVPELSASLVVSSSDWRPVAKGFKIPGQLPIEIREIAFELRNRPEPVLAVATPVGRATIPVPNAADRPAQPVSDLDLVEMRVLEVLRETAADRTEVPAIERRDGRVHVAAIAESAARREELAAALATLSDVEVHVVQREEAGTATSPDEPRRVVPPAYPTDPPLARMLWEYMGGMDSANDYLDSVHSRWLRAMSAARAMGRLAERYPDDDAAPRSMVSRERLLNLVGQYREEVATLAGAYLQQLNEPLDEMLRRNAVSHRFVAPEGCDAWQGSASEMVKALESLQLSVRRLFLIDYAEAPLTLSADTLLGEAEHARARLRQQLGCLDQP